MMNPLMIARALKAAVKLVLNPDLLGEVITLADSISTPAIHESMIAHISRDPAAARAIVERPRVGTINLTELRALPEGTLGREFAEHMIANKLDPAALPSREANDPASYLSAHLYETHDIWHAVTGFKTDVAGEMGLQAFYCAQFPARLGTAIVAGGLFNTLFFAFDERDVRMRAIVRGWLIGMRARPFFGVRWRDMWKMPIEDVRKSLDVDLASIEQLLPNLEPLPAPRAAA